MWSFRPPSCVFNSRYACSIAAIWRDSPSGGVLGSSSASANCLTSLGPPFALRRRVNRPALSMGSPPRCSTPASVSALTRSCTHAERPCSTPIGNADCEQTPLHGHGRSWQVCFGSSLMPRTQTCCAEKTGRDFRTSNVSSQTPRRPNSPSSLALRCGRAPPCHPRRPPSQDLRPSRTAPEMALLAPVSSAMLLTWRLSHGSTLVIRRASLN